MLPNLKSLAVFAKVAETLSFAAAAKVLHISAPVVSQHISQLEDTLGTALIYRSTRSLTLTEAGQKLARHAHDMLDAAETGFEAIQKDTKDYAGTLTMTVPSFVASPTFSVLLLEFTRRYPNINLAISYSTQIENLIDSGFDMAIRIGDLQDSNLMARKLMDGHGHVFASPGLLEKYGRPQSPEDIEALGIPWILPFRWDGMTLLKSGEPDQVFEIKTNARFQVDNGEADKQLALIDAGLILMPYLYVQKEVEEGLLVKVLPEWTTRDVGVYAVWPKNAGSRSLTRIFIDYMLETDLVKASKSKALPK